MLFLNYGGILNARASIVLDSVVACWLAANAFDNQEVQRLAKVLGIKCIDYFCKGDLVLLSEQLKFNWREIDNGIWCNYQYGRKLTHEQILDEIEAARADSLKQPIY